MPLLCHVDTNQHKHVHKCPLNWFPFPDPGVTDLPAELQRHFQGLRDLDVRVTSLQRLIDEDCANQLKEAAAQQQDGLPSPKRQRTAAAATPAPVGDPELAARIESNMNEVIKLSEEKVMRAQQIYDFIDQHIRKLDKDLKSFDAEVAKERARLGVPAPGTDGGAATGDGRRKRGKGAPIAPPPEELSAEELYQQALAVAPPSEPLYCTCKRISFGEMIACDNTDCPIEWFHYGCVGITGQNRPKGQWFCADCRRSLNK